MTKEEALERLELEANATTNEIKTQYNEFYNEFQIRITNAPTDHQRKLYQKKLEELDQAYKVLGGEGQDSDADLPSMHLTDSPKVEEISRETSRENSLIRARNVLKVSETTSRKDILLEYQTHKLELIEIISSRSGNIAEVAKEELKSVEQAVQVLVPDITEQELKPEVYGKKKTKGASSKFSVKIMLYIAAAAVVFGLAYYLISSGVFENDYQKDLDTAISLVNDKGDWEKAEPIFQSLKDTPVGEDAETWLLTIENIKTSEAEKHKQDFVNYMNSGNLIEAEIHFEKYNAITPMIKSDNELYVEWLKVKPDLEEMKSDYNELIASAKSKITNAQLDEAEREVKSALQVFPTSKEIKPLLSEIKETRVKYADCFRKMEEADAIVMLYSPGEAEYSNAKKIYQNIIKDCPTLTEARTKLSNMK